MSKNYNETLNLPKTEFAMRANLPAAEPETLKRWQQEDTYNALLEKNEGNPLYIFHDGPPYANGDIHMGHALNKVLKDIVVRFKNMTGHKAPFVPGWDTHGLPTELKAREKVGALVHDSMSDVELRKVCKDFAKMYVDIQKEQFKRLGILADFKNPYITYQKDYEATQIEVFAQMFEKGYIYRGLRPVYWCSDCKTALAEAEIEYHDDSCDSLYVKFKVKDDKGTLTSLGANLKNTYFVIWTTTAWSLPGNVAVCLGPDFDYSLVKCQGEFYVIAEKLVDKVTVLLGEKNYDVIGTVKGKDLEFITAEHPFLNRESLVIVGDHVTLESGTGCVHTAPAHGVEDFEVCQNYKNLRVIVPVDGNGNFTEEAGEFAGLNIHKSSKQIIERLKKDNLLFAVEEIKHQYPHCWRCKNPVFFRATKQWFCSVEDFKEKTLKEIEKVKWVPSWGQIRISNMVRERKDWCISRQRKWGVPIPVFFCKQCGQVIATKQIMLGVAKIFAQEGSDSWYELDAKEFLPKGFKCECCGSTKITKGQDIMDVWFDSGVSYEAAIRQRYGAHGPADLFFEGADQYRGWFQSSLLCNVAIDKNSPYKTVVTNGWVVDGEGKKQSKSLGNGINPIDVVNKYGADVLRLWVASTDYQSDVRLSEEILKQISESYRKIRNTLRFILGNLNDFDPNTSLIDFKDLEELDKYTLLKLNELIKKTLNNYENFEFHKVYHAIHNFCVVELSNFYLDIVKDRLYVEGKNSKTRRSAQTVIYLCLSALVKLMAPVLVFTTDEVFKNMPLLQTEDKRGAMFNQMPKPYSFKEGEEFCDKWDKLQSIQSDVKKALEILRKEKTIGSSLQAAITLHASGELHNFISTNQSLLTEILMVSSLTCKQGAGGSFKGEEVKELGIDVLKSDHEKCERCWNLRESVQDGLCDRCRGVLSNNE